MNYRATKSTLCIVDSYNVIKTKLMKEFLVDLKAKSECEELFKLRSISSLINEWVAHNVLYSLGYEIARTKDVDLDTEETTKRKIAYFLLRVGYPIIKLFI